MVLSEQLAGVRGLWLLIASLKSRAFSSPPPNRAPCKDKIVPPSMHKITSQSRPTTSISRSSISRSSVQPRMSFNLYSSHWEVVWRSQRHNERPSGCAERLPSVSMNYIPSQKFHMNYRNQLHISGRLSSQVTRGRARPTKTLAFHGFPKRIDCIRALESWCLVETTFLTSVVFSMSDNCPGESPINFLCFVIICHCRWNLHTPMFMFR